MKFFGMRQRTAGHGHAASRWTRAGACAVFLLLLGLSMARASGLEWIYTSCGSTACGNYGSGPFGQIVVTGGAGAGQNGLTFTVSMYSPYGFHNTATTQHVAFAFDLDYGTVPYSKINFSNITLTDPGGGTDAAHVCVGYTKTTTCPSPTSGTSSPPGFAGTMPLVMSVTQSSAAGAVLSFTITPAAGSGIAAFTTSDVTPDCASAALCGNNVSSNNPYFVGDVFLGSNTGSVGAFTSKSVPEPSTVALALVGLAGIVVARHRGRRHLPVAASR